MRDLLTPELEIDEGKVNQAAIRETVRLRNTGVRWALEVALGALYRRQQAHFTRVAERDQAEHRNRLRQLRLTLREAAILERSLQLEKAMHGLAMPYDKAEVERISAILTELKAQETAQLQAAE